MNDAFWRGKPAGSAQRSLKIALRCTHCRIRRPSPNSMEAEASAAWKAAATIVEVDHLHDLEGGMRWLAARKAPKHRSQASARKADAATGSSLIGVGADKRHLGSAKPKNDSEWRSGCGDESRMAGAAPRGR